MEKFILNDNSIKNLIKKHGKYYGHIHLLSNGKSFHTYNQSSAKLNYILIFQFDVLLKTFRPVLIDFKRVEM